jgi:hypothetical protein
MRRTTILLVVVLFGAVWVRAGRAQDTLLAVDPGTRLRVTACVPVCGTKVKGEVLQVDTDSLTLAGDNHTTTLSLADVQKVEVGTPYRFNGQRALKVGAVAALANGLLVFTSDEAQAADALAVAAVSGLMGAMLGGGGKKAARAGGVGALIFAPAIGILAAASYEPCTGTFCVFDSQGALFAMGAVAGAALGFVVGGAVGALTGGETWEDLHWNGVSLIAGPAPNGMTLGASVTF